MNGFKSWSATPMYLGSWQRSHRGCNCDHKSNHIYHNFQQFQAPQHNRSHNLKPCQNDPGNNHKFPILAVCYYLPNNTIFPKHVKIVWPLTIKQNQLTTSKFIKEERGPCLFVAAAISRNEKNRHTTKLFNMLPIINLFPTFVIQIQSILHRCNTFHRRNRNVGRIHVGHNTSIWNRLQ